MAETRTANRERDALRALGAIGWDFHGAQTAYLTHGLHPYPAKYIPQIPHHLIAALSDEGETIADIFCGSGTTLVEALALGRNALGIDANPLACLISRAKTTRFAAGDQEALNALSRKVRRLWAGLLGSNANFRSEAPRPADEALEFWFEPAVVEELAEILAGCRELPTESTRNVALAAFSSIVVAVSRQDSDTRYVRREKRIATGDPWKRFLKALDEATQAVSRFTQAVDPGLHCTVIHGNILDGPRIEPVDLVVCSPPYPNAYSYHLYHMTRMLWLGMDQPSFKRVEIGSHRKYSNRGPNGATAETFRNEMRSIFNWLRAHLRPGRHACFVVGDSTIAGEKVDNAELIASVGSEQGFEPAACFTRRMQDTRKAFNPDIGKIKTEKIVILRRSE
jgi:DNA modification methylase